MLISFMSQMNKDIERLRDVKKCALQRKATWIEQEELCAFAFQTKSGKNGESTQVMNIWMVHAFGKFA